MHESKSLVSRLAIASCRTPKLRAHGKSVESYTHPVSSPATLAQDCHQMHSARVYSRHEPLEIYLATNTRRMYCCWSEYLFGFCISCNYYLESRDFENSAIGSLSQSVELRNLLTVTHFSLHPMLLAAYYTSGKRQVE